MIRTKEFVRQRVPFLKSIISMHFYIDDLNLTATCALMRYDEKTRQGSRDRFRKCICRTTWRERKESWTLSRSDQAMISRSRERQCPNNGLESESSDFWRRPASDLSKVFFLLSAASACWPSLFLVRVEKKKETMFPWKLPSGYYGVPSGCLLLLPDDLPFPQSPPNSTQPVFPAGIFGPSPISQNYSNTKFPRRQFFSKLG